MLLPVFTWYLVIALVGLATFPLAYRLLPALEDRGYAFSRAMGLMLWGYGFWLLSSLGVLSNDLGGIFLILAAVFGLSWWAWRDINLAELRGWAREQKNYLIAIEVLFAAAFLFLIVLRGMAPEIIGTEKPMELAFINAILRSPSMPPYDPWLADYAISYYYFGYVIVGLLARVTGVGGGVAFNLGISLVFALGAAGAYGLVYNLLGAVRPRFKLGNAVLALFGPLFVLIVSNVEGFLEFLHGRGYFWTQTAEGQWVSNFWTKLELKDLVDPPNLALGERRFWWWWRASRVVQDCNMPVETLKNAGISSSDGVLCFGELAPYREIIDEFPFFSFYLGDLHPHVLAIPFIFLALALVLNTFLAKNGGRIRLFNRSYAFSWQTFALGTVVFGGLAFLNIWDFPWYVGLFAAAHLLKRAGEDGWRWERITEFLLLGIALGIAGVAAYLPFYIGFSSQAGGILPNLINPTRGAHLWVMFGTLFLPLFSFLAYLLVRKRDRRGLVKGLAASVGLTAALLGFSLLLAALIVNLIPALFSEHPLLSTVGEQLMGLYYNLPLGEVLAEGWARRGAAVGGGLTLTAITGLAVAYLWPQPRGQKEAGEEKNPAGFQFAVLLILFGGLMVTVPEFVYLRDQFGTRMNTVFKFYYQAWLLWGIAAGFGSAVLLGHIKKWVVPTVYGLGLVAVLTVGLTYPLIGIKTRLEDFNRATKIELEREGLLDQSAISEADNEPSEYLYKNGIVRLKWLYGNLNLDGTDHGAFLTDDDKAAVAWLNQAPLGTLVEAVGGSYTHFARISTHSGQISLLGWPGHESQWRGGWVEVGSREGDIRRLYETGSWDEALYILNQYGVRYVYIGPLERSTYNLSDAKFIRGLTPVFQQGAVTIYELPEFPRTTAGE